MTRKELTLRRIFRKQKVFFSLLFLTFLHSKIAYSLPIGFRINQGELVYKEIKHEDFHFFHDQRTESEARFLLQSAIKAKPILDLWFQRKRSKPLPVITSAVTSNASFANFITDGIELQTLGRGNRDLILHEYVHMMMFLYLQNFLGPVASIIHLPWLPAWWVEGLAEALSVSAGSTAHYGIERYQALTDTFPSYDQLHSLYGSSFHYRGYSTAGRFFTYIIKKIKSPNILEQLHEDFYFYSMPWFWPVTIIPFANLMPLDIVLKKYTKFTGRELYQQYIKDAKKYWQKAKLPLVIDNPKDKYFTLSNTYTVQTKQKSLVTIAGYEDGVHTAEIIFDEKSGLATGLQKTPSGLPHKNIFFSPRSSKPEVYVKYSRDLKTGLPKNALVMISGLNEITLQEGNFRIVDIFSTANKIVFLEHNLSHISLCYYEKKDWRKKHCPISKEYPQSLYLLGYQAEQKKIWLRLKTESPVGYDKYRILTWSEQGGVIEKAWPFVSRPIKVVFNPKTRFLVAEHKFRSIIELDSQWRCVSKILFADHLTNLFSYDQQLVAGLYTHGGHVLARIPETKIARVSQPCRTLKGHSSPLLYAMQQESIPSFPQALASYENAVDTQQAASYAPIPNLNSLPSEDVSWRGRPLFIFPLLWKGDVWGWQMGVVSVPLMDSLQNETLVANFRYGLRSRYPSVDLTLTSTRFWPTLTLSLFRQQTYNGFDRKRQISYYDELGARTFLTTAMYLGNNILRFSLGLSSSRLEPYVGSVDIPHGMASNITTAISLRNKSKAHEWSIQTWGVFYPPIINKVFNYYRLGLEIDWTARLPFWNSELVNGAMLIGTRGKKTKNLQEIYQVLQTYVAGSGGGINKMNIPIISGGGLFSYREGDTKARVKTALVIPVIKDFDKIFWILYIDRLNFNALYNYGGAWHDKDGLNHQDFVFAHSYSLDLLLNNKGVNFNIGIGTGQVAYKPFEAYINFGFDALF